MTLRTLALLLALAARGEACQEGTQDPEHTGPRRQELRRIVAPDGSAFLLARSGGAPVVFLATATACGRSDEPLGLEGLSLAVERASFNGTADIGGRDKATEEAILRDEDGLCRELAKLRILGSELPPELLEKLAAVRARAAAATDPLEFRRRLNALAATDPRVDRCPDGTVVTTSFPAENLTAVLELLRARRDRTVLRGFQAEFERVREELAREEREDPLRPARAEVLTLAYKRHPYRRAMDSASLPVSPCDRSRAIAFFQEHHRPGRTVTVLTGGFEMGAAEESIRAVHAERGSVDASPPDLPVEPEQEGARTGQLSPSQPELLCIGYRAPRGARRAHLDVLAKLLGSGPGSLIWKRLVEQGAATGGDVHASFPGSLSPGLFLIDVAVAPGRSSQTARDEVFRVLQTLAEQGPAEADLDRAQAVARAEILRETADPESLATLLATQGLGQDVAPDPWLLAEDYGAITGSALRETAAALFKPGRRTVVFSLPEEKVEKK